jgi:hypothetical protein
MSNTRPYASPYNNLPGPNTLIAGIVKSMPETGAATVTDICAGAGIKARSARALISTACERVFIRAANPAHTIPQTYTLTPIGRLAKQYYLALGD